MYTYDYVILAYITYYSQCIINVRAWGLCRGPRIELISSWRGVPQGSPQGQRLRALLLRVTSLSLSLSLYLSIYIYMHNYVYTYMYII